MNVVVLETNFGLLNDRLVFFPTAESLRSMVAGLSFRDLVRVRQTALEVGDDLRPIFRDRFVTSCIDLTRPLDEIFRAMDSKSCRYEIRRAEKLADQLSIATGRNAVSDFVQLYNSFAAKKGHSGPLKEETLLRSESVLDVLVLNHLDRPVCGHVILRDDGARRVRLFYSASTRLDGTESAALSGPFNRYLHWSEIQHYKEQGFQIYDFGGVDEGEPGIASFKRSFGGALVEDNTYYFGGPLARTGYWLFRALPDLRRRLKGRLPT